MGILLKQALMETEEHHDQPLQLRQQLQRLMLLLLQATHMLYHLATQAGLNPMLKVSFFLDIAFATHDTCGSIPSNSFLVRSIGTTISSQTE